MRKSFKPGNPIFLATVVVPTLLAALYFGVLASDVYISESRFVIRSPTKATTSTLGMILGGSGFANAGEENHAVIDYLRSRAALDDTNWDNLVEKAYATRTVSWFDRFGGLLGGNSHEHLYKYFSDKVQVDYDTSTQVTKLTVRAFTADEARAINRRLLDHSEGLVNRLSQRGRTDTIAQAQAEVDEAKARAHSAAVALARYRNRRGLLDPEQQASVKLQMISKLQDELIAVRTQLLQIETYTPGNPQIPSLRTRVAALGREIQGQSGEVAGGDGSLSAAAVQYQQLQLDSEFAGKQLTASLASLQDARSEARKKQAYVERIAEPNLPDYPLEPRRIRGILATFVLGLLAWGILSTLTAGIREHRD